MISITYTTEHCDTKIKSVNYYDESYSGDENTFDIGQNVDYIYLLVETIDEDCCCCCGAGSIEEVIKVYTDFKEAIDKLVVTPEPAFVQDSIHGHQKSRVYLSYGHTSYQVL
jgi:hypothetical protein